MNAVDEPEPGSQRTLADILREAGIEPAGRGGRRRRAEASEGTGPEPDGSQWSSPPTARHGRTAPTEPGDVGPTGAEGAGHQRHPRSQPERPAIALRDPDTTVGSEPDTDPTPDPDAEPRTEEFEVVAPPEPPAGFELRTSPAVATSAPPRGRGRHGADSGDRGRIEQAGEDGPEPSRHGAAVGWLILATELLAAAVLGVVIWYAFSLLWELYPYIAAVAAPVVLAGLVLAGQLLRRARSQEPMGPSVIAVLLLVAAFLVVFPAASVLARS